MRTKVLVFVPTIGMAERMAEQVRKPAQSLTSNSKEIDSSVDIYFSTPVADVGITIDGLDVVISPNIEGFVGSSGFDFRAASTQLLKQRKGRVGRVKNGIYLQFDLLGVKNIGSIDEPIVVDDYRSMLASGLPFELAVKVDKHLAFSALQLSSEAMEDASFEETCRGIGVFLRNISPLCAEISTNADFDERAGKHVSLQGTGLGDFNLQGVVLSAEERVDALMKLVKPLVLAARDPNHSLSDDVDAAVSDAATLPGPILHVRYLFDELVADIGSGVSEIYNFATKGVKEGAESVYEIAQIASLLSNL